MALVVNLEPAAQGRNTVHAPLWRCTYKDFLDPAGGTIFQISSYGQEGRENEQSISQSIQLREETARALIQHLKDAFPTLADA